MFDICGVDSDNSLEGNIPRDGDEGRSRAKEAMEYLLGSVRVHPMGASPDSIPCLHSSVVLGTVIFVMAVQR